MSYIKSVGVLWGTVLGESILLGMMLAIHSQLWMLLVSACMLGFSVGCLFCISLEWYYNRGRTVTQHVRIPFEHPHGDINPYSIFQNIHLQDQEDIDPLDPRNITPFDVYLASQFMPKEEETEE